MYKIASSNLQHAARSFSRIAPANPEEFEIAPEAERDSIKSRMKQVECELLELSKRDPRRVELGLLKFELQNAMRAIRPKLRGPRNLPGAFMEVAREMLPRHTFQMIQEAASVRLGAKPLKEVIRR